MIVLIHIIRIAFITTHLLLGALSPDATAEERPAGTVVTVSATSDIQIEREDGSIFIPFPPFRKIDRSMDRVHRLSGIEVLLEADVRRRAGTPRLGATGVAPLHHQGEAS